MIVIPIITWLITGIVKFLISCLKYRRIALDKIGYGGFPSNHSSICAATASYLGFKFGLNSPYCLTAATLLFIVSIDAKGLRRHVGKNAQAINQIAGLSQHQLNLRTQIGHSITEVIAGIIWGSCIGYCLFYLDI